MDLLTYITDMARRADLAVATGNSPDYLWQIATGRRKASHHLARQIEIHTSIHGLSVSKESLRPDIWGACPTTKRKSPTKPMKRVA